MNDSKIRALFDYQKFAGNKKLDAVISKVTVNKRELSQDDLEMVSAAGLQVLDFIKTPDEK